MGMRVKQVLSDGGSPDDAIRNNIQFMVETRRMRNGKLSEDAVRGIQREAEVWAKAYVSQARKQGKDIGGIAKRLSALVEEVCGKHMATAERIDNYKR